MKTISTFSTLLILSLAVSCSQVPAKKTAKMKTLGPLDLSAKSAPIDGYNYYSLPSNAPTMDKKLKTSKNTTTTTTTVKKSSVKK